MRTLPLLSLVLATAAASLGCQSGASLGLTDEPDRAALAVIPSLTTLGGGLSLRLTAKVHNPDGSITTPSDVVWTSANEAIASVDRTGTVHGLRAGRAQIVATWGDARGSSLVTVLDQVAKKPPPPLCREKGTSAKPDPTIGKCL